MGRNAERGSRYPSGARPSRSQRAGGTGATAFSEARRTAYAVRAGTPDSRPGGTPEEISRGQGRPSGRRPRILCLVTPCPNGASKKMAWGDAWWRKCCGENAAKDFFDAPLGHDFFEGATGGRARSADLPPANFLRSPSGTKSKAMATILRPSAVGQGSGKILAANASFQIFSDERSCRRSALGRARLSSARRLRVRTGRGALGTDAPYLFRRRHVITPASWSARSRRRR